MQLRTQYRGPVVMELGGVEITGHSCMCEVERVKGILLHDWGSSEVCKVKQGTGDIFLGDSSSPHNWGGGKQRTLAQLDTFLLLPAEMPQVVLL